MTIDLKPEHLDMVTKILADFVPEFEVWAFGSRVLGKAREYSDLDLVIITDAPLEKMRYIDIKDAFDDSMLPIRVDVLDWACVNAEFKDIIKAKYVVIQNKS